MQSLRIIYLLILCLYFFNTSFATNYYVDNTATGNNSGSSWTNAWESFADINWSLIQPGDIIYISGGSSSKTYFETLNIGTHGEPGNNVLISKGIDPGYNGDVIIDGQDIRECGIDFNSTDDYVTVRGFTIRNTTSSCIILKGGVTGSSGNYSWSNPIVGSRVEYCKMHLTNRRGVFAQGTTRLYFYKNVITTSSNSPAETDGFFSQASSYNTWDGNSIIISNNNEAPHCDGIQINQDTSDVVKNCYIEQNNSKSSNAQGIYATQCWGNFIYYNNVVNLTLSNSNGIAVRNFGGNAIAEIYGNVVFGQAGADHAIYCTEQVSPPLIKNNIIRSLSGGFGTIVVTGSNTSGVSHNSITGGGSVGSNVITGNPLFTDELNGIFTLQENSPCIDAGTYLSAPYNVDIIGTSRPQGNGWDIGAYEMVFGPDITPPEVEGAVLIDSLTLRITFSEPLEESSAENINNYSITNGITVYSAVLNVSVVTLSTSIHSPGQYTVTVSSVKDLAGNQITSNSNSADYVMLEDPTGGELEMLDIINVTASVVPEPVHAPEKTIDGKGYFQGDPDSRWSGDTMPEWIQFDLGLEQVLEHCKLSFYRWNDGRIYNYSILVSTDNNNWTEVLSHLQSVSEEWTMSELGGIRARYLRLIFHSSNQTSWASLWECEIWGYDQTNSNGGSIFTPEGFYLSQNYPNPFNPSTQILVSLPSDQEIKLSVYSMLGELVSELANGNYSAGTHKFEFNASGLPTGVYFYRIESPEFTDTKKMVLMQ
jgi:hypothetical protein